MDIIIQYNSKPGEPIQPMEAMPYEYWLNEYVNMGKAHHYNIFRYPNIAILTILNGEGKKVKELIEDYLTAKKMRDDNTNIYSFHGVDKKQLIEKQFKRSKLIEKIKELPAQYPKQLLIRLLTVFINFRSFEIYKIENNYQKWISFFDVNLIDIISILFTAYIAFR